MLRIRQAFPIDGYKVRLVLTDGSVVERDLESEIGGKVFAPLRENASLFRQVQVVDGTLSWSNGVDLDPDMVI